MKNGSGKLVHIISLTGGRQVNYIRLNPQAVLTSSITHTMSATFRDTLPISASEELSRSNHVSRNKCERPRSNSVPKNERGGTNHPVVDLRTNMICRLICIARVAKNPTMKTKQMCDFCSRPGHKTRLEIDLERRDKLLLRNTVTELA